MNTSRVLLVLSISLAFFLACRANAGEFTVDIDRPTLVGISYDENNVPGPFQGVWILVIRYPNSLEDHSVYTWSWRKVEATSIRVGWSIRIPRSDGGHSEISLPDRFRIDVENWSNGMYNAAERKELVEGRVLLDFDRIPNPVCEKGLLPEGLSIRRHVIGYRGGDEGGSVAYQADDMNTIRKFHDPPLFFKWGRNLDQSYRMDQNEEWLNLLEERQPGDG